MERQEESTREVWGSSGADRQVHTRVAQSVWTHTGPRERKYCTVKGKRSTRKGKIICIIRVIWKYTPIIIGK